MTPDRWRQISAIYNAAIARAGADREAYVAQACRDDAGMRRDVESLLAQGESFLANPVTLPQGNRLGPYEVVSILGAGGMGVVYRARDARLQRDVALKVLPAAFALDPDRAARFKREAQVLASLNHSHIAAIYGLEESGGVHALVLELVEGPTLADRIAQGPISLEEALPIARQITEALEAAHEQGIIHRDLKPANIKVRDDGTVKVLDFGLAKLVESAGSAQPATSSASVSPTITSPVMLTGVGVLLGTAAYMSPEQARGKPADKRGDIWAFGCVLYEMLTGKSPFVGDGVGDTLANVLKTEVNWPALPPNTSPSIRRLLRRALEKDARHRLADIADARLDLDEGTTTSAEERTQLTRPALFPWLLVGLLATCAAILAFVHFDERPAEAPPETRVEVATPPTLVPTSISVSPDGRTVAFVAPSESGPRLWLRRLDSTVARSLAGTENATYPFWSPSGRSIGFFADFQLKRIDVDGGLVQTIARAPLGLGGAWNADDTIVFAPTRVSPLFSVPARGGMPIPLTHLDQSQVGHRFPEFLPDGRHFLYYVEGAADARGIYVGQTGSSETTRLLDADSDAAYASGQLLFARQDKLFAQAFDPMRLIVSGDMRPVAPQVAVDAVAHAALSASAGDSIMYRSGTGLPQREFVWFDRSGNMTGRAGASDSRSPFNASMTRDGQRIAFQSYVNGNIGTWLMDTAKGVLSPLTPEYAAYPVWSPDSRVIAFQAIRNGRADLYLRNADGDDSESLLVSTSEIKVPHDWSPDGRFVLYSSVDATTGGYSLAVVTTTEPHTSTPLLKADVNARCAQFSPDGGWIAYQSNLSGRWEVYLQPFPGSSGRREVSIAGGAQPRWRPDGKELFFIALDGQLMSVPLRTNSKSGQLEAGTPVPLFATRVGGAVQSVNRQQYMVAPDGRRFLMSAIEDTPTPPLTLFLNWTGPR